MAPRGEEQEEAHEDEPSPIFSSDDEDFDPRRRSVEEAEEEAEADEEESSSDSHTAKRAPKTESRLFESDEEYGDDDDKVFLLDPDLEADATDLGGAELRMLKATQCLLLVLLRGKQRKQLKLRAETFERRFSLVPPWLVELIMRGEWQPTHPLGTFTVVLAKPPIEQLVWADELAPGAHVRMVDGSHVDDQFKLRHYH